MEILSCPHCRTPLRLRERPAQPIEIHCPECKQPLEVFEDDAGLAARSVTRPAPGTGKSAGRGEKTVAAATIGMSQRLTALKPILLQRLSDPLIVTWMAAGVAATALGVAFIRASDTADPPIESPLSKTVASVDEVNSTSVTPVPAVSSRPEAPLAEASQCAQSPITAIPPGPSRAPVVAAKPRFLSVVDPRELVRAHLVQRLVRFEQPKAVPFDTIRIQLEELAGVTIRYDDKIVDDSATHQRPVQLVLENATIGTVLHEIARQADLDVVVDADGIRLVTAPAAENDQAQVMTES